MTASITNIINVALIPEGQAAARDNMNVVCLMTSEQGVLSSAERFRAYRSAQAVEADWGTASAVSQYAATFFGTQPNAVNFGGSLIVGYYRGQAETVPATSATLHGVQLSEPSTLQTLNTVDNGSFIVEVDGVEQTVASLDFRTAISFDDVAEIIDTELTGATFEHVNGRFILTSSTTGATSTLGYFTPEGAGEFIGDILALSDGSGASLVQGADEEVLAVEDKLEGLSAVKAEVNFKGVCFIDRVLDAEVPTIAAWAGANSVLVYNVFSGSTYLEVSTDNPVWQVRLASQNEFRCLYSKAGNRKLAVTYMARAHTVNFNAENTAITMNLKTLSVPAEEYSQTEIDSAYRVGLDIYTSVKDVPVVLTSPANDFVDNVYNLIAFVDAVQTDMFNLLSLTGTKIPQTRRGVQQLVDQGEKTTRGFVRAGVFAPGTWSSPDSFGNIEVFNRAIEEDGFYWLAGSLADQPQSDRQERKSPVLQAAVKNAGAIHKADVIINFNL